MVIKKKEDLINWIWEEYCREATEMSEAFFSGVLVDMTKADLMEAYAEIQKKANGDTVIRLDVNRQEMEELVPGEWRRTRIGGDAEQILKDINEMGLTGKGPLFARKCGEDESILLDLLFGRFTA